MGASAAAPKDSGGPHHGRVRVTASTKDESLGRRHSQVGFLTGRPDGLVSGGMDTNRSLKLCLTSLQALIPKKLKLYLINTRIEKDSNFLT